MNYWTNEVCLLGIQQMFDINFPFTFSFRCVSNAVMLHYYAHKNHFVTTSPKLNTSMQNL